MAQITTGVNITRCGNKRCPYKSKCRRYSAKTPQRIYEFVKHFSLTKSKCAQYIPN